MPERTKGLSWKDSRLGNRSHGFESHTLRQRIMDVLEMVINKLAHLKKGRVKECSVMDPIGKVYLAGPITGLDFEGATGWRETATKLLHPVEALSPMRYKAYLKEYGKLLSSYGNSTVRHPLSTDDGITARDHFDVKRSALILMNFLGADERSIGTCIEIGWASAYRVPIVLLMEEEGNVHDHGMVKSIADFRTTSLEEGVDIVKAILLPSY